MVKQIKIHEKKPVDVYFIGDMHVGAKACRKKEILRTIEIVKNNPNARAILMGDLGEYIESDDTRRYDVNAIDPLLNTAYKQYEWLYKVLKPIQKKIYGILRGNHEATYYKTHQSTFIEMGSKDFCDQLAKQLKTEYLEELAIITLIVKNKEYNLVVAHGAGTTLSLAGQINALKNIINSFEVVPDLVATGHVHTLQTIINPKMDFKFKTKIKHLALTGNYFQTYIEGDTSYASSSLYNPLPIGCVMYTFDEKGNIKDNKIIF